MSSGCLDIEGLERFATGAVSKDERTSIEAHVTSCDSCSSALTEVRDNLALESPLRSAITQNSSSLTPHAKPAPDRIGPYRTLRELGRGGMGVVYEAEQDAPRRRIAIKTLLPATVSRAPVALSREADALARLKHPGIATIYEVGQTTDGVAFLAMELVDGVPLGRFVSERKPKLRQRIEMSLQVCRAVAHAHQRGIIHRDLKPSNVMVTAEGEIKVLDFGLSRIVDDDAAASIYRSITRAGHIAGTVPYMSPEQVRGEPGALDVRSDVYSLGVLIYEALTGAQPYDLSTASLPEAARIVCEHDPATPVIDGRRADRDLSAILLKALEKDPERRYASAAALADDLERYLASEPVLARPATLVYQLRKLVRRHLIPAASLAALILVILAASAYSSVMAIRLGRQREEAARQARIAALVNAFLEDTLSAADPEVSTAARGTTIQEAVQNAASHLDAGGLRETPEVEAEVRAVVGNIFRSLGRYDAAIQQLQRSVSLHEKMTPDGSEAMAYSLHKLGRALDDHGDLEAAEAVTRRALAMRRRLLGPDHGDLSKTLNNLGWLVARLGRYHEAETILEDALKMRRAIYGASSPEIATTLNNLAALRLKQRNPKAAEQLFRESLEMDRACRGNEHTNIASTMSNLAVALTQQGKLDEAAQLQEDALRLRITISGEEHPLVATTLNNLGQLRHRQGRYADAQQCYDRAVELERASRGERTVLMATLLSNQAEVDWALGESERAVNLHRRALEIRRAVLPRAHPATLKSCVRWIELAASLEVVEASRSAVDDCMARVGDRLPDDHPFWRDSRSLLARIANADDSDAD